MAKLKNRVGEKYITNEGYEVEIIEYFGIYNCTIRFKDISYTVLTNTFYWNIKKGYISNPNHRTICNVGYFGQGKYKSSVNRKMTKFYIIWKLMIERCYNKKTQEDSPTYINCLVCEEWHSYQNFAKWYEENYKEGFELDKDILVKGNKVYSPETCCFVPAEINTLFVSNKKDRGKFPVGICKVNDKFSARINKNKKRIWLGAYNTPEEAFRVYKKAKEECIKEKADEWKDRIDQRVYEAMYNYKVEITD